VDTNISEGHDASVFRVKVTVMIYEDCILITLTLTMRMEASFSSEMLVLTCSAAWCHSVKGVWIL
jgi:hypothetical protein